MIRKSTIPIIALLFLIGCTAERVEIAEGSGFAHTAPVTIPDSAFPVPEKLGTVEIIGDDEQALREFIRRWFTTLYPSPAPEKATIIWIGKLPEEIVVDFPLTKGAQVVASVQDPYSDLQVIADVPATMDEFLSNYAELLTKSGWKTPPDISAGIGFSSASEPWFTFCDDQGEAALTRPGFPR